MAKKKPAPKKAGRKRTRKKADWTPAFLAALSQTGNVRAACEASRVGKSTVYDRVAADQSFAARFDSALDDAVMAMELEARRRAVEGVRRLKFHQGDVIMVPLTGADGSAVLGADGEPVLVPYVEHEYSDTLMIFLLKSHRPEKYRDNVRLDVGGEVVVRRYVGIDPAEV